MEFQAMVTELNSLIGKPVRVVSTIGGQLIGGDGVLKDVHIPRPGNRQDHPGGSRARVEFKDGRMFALDPETIEISKVSKDAAEEGENKSLNAAEGDTEETDEAKADRETREKGETVGARKRSAHAVNGPHGKGDSEDDEAEDESEDAEAVEETPKVKKAKKSARVAKSRK